jgi:hypothetical protein
VSWLFLGNHERGLTLWVQDILCGPSMTTTVFAPQKEPSDLPTCSRYAVGMIQGGDGREMALDTPPASDSLGDTGWKMG